MHTLKNYEPWPALPYEAFKDTAYLLHMSAQIIGKIKLETPFEPHWANVALWVTSRGLTTGPIPYKSAVFSIEMDFIAHQIICTTSWGRKEGFGLAPMSVAEFYKYLFDILHTMEIDITINPKPQEIPDPILFDHDTKHRPYDATLANAWWRILISSHHVMQQYHAKFQAETPPIGLMWGTFDLRDARYNGKRVPTTGINAGYIRRNAMDEAQVEMGWWAGNAAYPRPAYFSFMYPTPAGLEQAKIKPSAAHWDKSLGEFVLDYDDVRNAKHPDAELLAFCESTYEAGAKLAGWDSKLIGSGKPV